MINLVQNRRSFFSAVLRDISYTDGDIIVLTHILKDRIEFLEAVASIARVRAVIAIPYSIHPETLAVLQSRYTMIVPPSLESLRDPEWLLEIAFQESKDRRTCVVEVGGYFAPYLQEAQRMLNGNLAGAVEDTEAGHRAYEALTAYPCPVLSAARSPLKQGEDAMVGRSCIFSTERLLRKLDMPLEPRIALVLGYGKVGRGVASSLQRRQCHTTVYDIDPVRRACALGEGFAIPRRNLALAAADIVFGATGTRSLSAADFEILKPGTVLVSCSSRDVEFDLDHIQQTFVCTEPTAAVLKCVRRGKSLVVLAEGRPVNFLDAGVIGPSLYLTQGELLISAARIFEGRLPAALSSISAEDRNSIAQCWLKEFSDDYTGLYAQT